MSFGTVQAEKMTTESGYSLGAGNASSFKNRIINGNMTVSQYTNGATLTNVFNSGTYFVDRFRTGGNNFATGRYSISQPSDAPSGFSKSVRIDVTTTQTVNDLWTITQAIEGYNTSDFNLGTATAKALTLSFWVKGGTVGTYALYLHNTDDTRSFVTTYTINSADTWEYKTISIAAPTSGTFSTINTKSLRVDWVLNVATAGITASLNTWISGDFTAASGCVNLLAVSGGNWSITGVQLEVGTVATSFDFRSYGTELALCQRYFARFNSLGGAYRGVGAGVTESATSISCVVKYPVAMRAGPTASGTGLATYDGSSVRAVTAFATQYSGSDAMNINLTVGGGGMTTNRPANLISDNSGTGYFDLSVEL
jgi:hypothetical protein